MNIDFPDHARLWIYAADRQLDEKETTDIQQNITQFAANWKSHGDAMQAEGLVLHNQFLLLIADESKISTGGCSMDSSVHFIQELGKKHQVDFFNRMLFHSYQNSKIITYDRASLNKAYQSEGINEETLFFNPLVKTYGEYKLNWLIALKDSWVMRMLPA